MRTICIWNEVTDFYIREILDEIIDKRLGFGQIWNVNFPDCPLSECKGILRDRVVSEGKFFDDTYKVVSSNPSPFSVPAGNDIPEA